VRRKLWLLAFVIIELIMKVNVILKHHNQTQTVCLTMISFQLSDAVNWYVKNPADGVSHRNTE
jgi:uncharacterized membrane protein